MDNFKIIYRILKALEKSMDNEEFEPIVISPEVLGISPERWKKLIKMLVEEGYMEGVRIVTTNTGAVIVKMLSPTITLKGLEYLNENSLMQKAANVAKGIADIVS